MVDAHLVLSFARIMTAALAGTIGLLAARAYVRSRRRSLLTLSIGASLLAAGHLAAGVLVEVGRWSVHDASVLESIVTLAAVVVLVASLYLKEKRSGRARAASVAGDAP